MGEVSSFHNELQLKVEDISTIKVLDQGLPVSATSIKTSDVSEDLEGSLVIIAGTLTKNQGQTIFIDDGSGEARVLIRDSTGIAKPKMRKGDQVQVTGLVSQFNDNYRLLPRFQDDIRVGGVAGSKILPRTGSNIWLVLALFLGLCYIITTVFLLFKLKK